MRTRSERAPVRSEDGWLRVWGPGDQEVPGRSRRLASGLRPGPSGAKGTTRARSPPPGWRCTASGLPARGLRGRGAGRTEGGGGGRGARRVLSLQQGPERSLSPFPSGRGQAGQGRGSRSPRKGWSWPERSAMGEGEGAEKVGRGALQKKKKKKSEKGGGGGGKGWGVRGAGAAFRGSPGRCSPFS